jgi:hypothetical protein
MIKRLLIAVVLLGVVCGGIVYFNMFRNQAIQDFFATMEAPPVAVSAQTAEAGEWQPGLEAIGTVSAAAGIDVAVETSGVVEAVNFGSNDQVEQGDVWSSWTIPSSRPILKRPVRPCFSASRPWRVQPRCKAAASAQRPMCRRPRRPPSRTALRSRASRRCSARRS